MMKTRTRDGLSSRITLAEEVTMKRLVVLAAFLLASSAVQAQYTFDYGGRTIRIDPDRGTVSIPGVYDNTGRRKRQHTHQGDAGSRKPASEQAKVDPQAPPASSPTQNDQASSPGTAPVNPSSAPSDVTANGAPDAQTFSPPKATASSSAPIVATAPTVGPREAPQAATAQPLITPLGLWLTAEKEGKVRIEQCGVNLCGYSVDAKSNQNGEQVLINMKPGNDAKWNGRILDPSTGSTYDSTIALQGSDTLRIQGCAMGGMFCGGQTWSRLN
jgi:uncharacterized protein (DUF2147 family)